MRRDPVTGLAIRGTTNRNARGSSADRRARRVWLLRTFDPDLGDEKCRCSHCGVLLDNSTITVDRVLPGCQGGTYKRGNIRPSCGPCNSETGGHLGVKQKRNKGRIEPAWGNRIT